MDTSETYIKMCEKAEEIQAECVFAADDIVATLRGVWIPRQDQLQEIWSELAGVKLPDSLPEFYHFAEDNYPGELSSMEQLWLAFVMEETYGKVWNGEEWIE